MRFLMRISVRAVPGGGAVFALRVSQTRLFRRLTAGAFSAPQAASRGIRPLTSVTAQPNPPNARLAYPQ